MILLIRKSKSNDVFIFFLCKITLQQKLTCLVMWGLPDPKQTLIVYRYGADEKLTKSTTHSSSYCVSLRVLNISERRNSAYHYHNKTKFYWGFPDPTSPVEGIRNLF